MRNEFFGDQRDYFKYDLIESLMEELEELRRLVFVWMLTPDQGRGHGDLRTYRPSKGAEKLYEFLRESPRDVRQLRAYFANRQYAYLPYGELQTEYLRSRGRNEYFRNIRKDWLRDALLFFDPDNGLEPA